MRKTFIAAAITALAAGPASAMAGNGGLLDGAKFDLSAGVADVYDLSDSATVVKAGYQRDLNVVDGASVGLDVAKSVSDAESDFGAEVEYLSVGAYAGYSYGLDRFVDDLSVNAKVGYGYVDYDVIDESDVVVGAGLSYDLDDHTSVVANFETIDEVEQTTIGLQYGF